MTPADFLRSRRSVPSRLLGDPGPSAEQLNELLADTDLRARLDGVSARLRAARGTELAAEHIASLA